MYLSKVNVVIDVPNSGAYSRIVWDASKVLVLRMWANEIKLDIDRRTSFSQRYRHLNSFS